MLIVINYIRTECYLILNMNKYLAKCREIGEINEKEKHEIY